MRKRLWDKSRFGPGFARYLKHRIDNGEWEQQRPLFCRVRKGEFSERGWNRSRSSEGSDRCSAALRARPGTEIFSVLSPDEIQRILTASESIRDVRAEEVLQVLRELNSQLVDKLQGSRDTTTCFIERRQRR